MKELIRLRHGLGDLQPGTRFAYTLFLGFCGAAYAVMTVLAVQRSGLAPSGIAAYYAGDAATQTYGKTPGEMLEVTHFHLFAMPMLLFVQGHLFLLTRWPMRVKVALVVAGTLGIALDLAAPWLIVYVSRDLAALKDAARVLMAVAFTAFAVVPLWEMWGPGGRRQRAAAAAS